MHFIGEAAARRSFNTPIPGFPTSMAELIAVILRCLAITWGLLVYDTSTMSTIGLSSTKSYSFCTHRFPTRGIREWRAGDEYKDGGV